MTELRMSDIQTDLIERARTIIDAGRERGVELRLVGSGGFRQLASDPAIHTDTFDREMGDIDLVGLSADSDAIQTLFEEFEYEIDKDLLLAGWGNRYVFYGADHEVDVFLDEVSMCHTIAMQDRLTAGPDQYALPPADLLLEKAQIVEINEKDLKDLTLLLMEMELTDDDTGINRSYIAGLLAGDWGFYHTVTTNLHKLQNYLGRAPIDDAERERVESRLEELLTAIETEPKSLRWKARSKLGERKKWYTEVEEKHR